METDTLTHRPSNGQLILVPHKDTIRLLEVYVKRSLSLNDGTLGDKKSHRKEKWVTVRRKERRHSSDPSLHLIDGFQDSEVGPFSAVDSETKEPETIFEEPEKPTKKSKKIKKPSLFKNIFGIFSRKSTEDKSEDEEGPPETTVVDKSEGSSDTLSNCLPTTPSSSQRRKSSRKKSRRRKISKRLSIINKPNNNPDITRIDDVVSVEPTYSYYEKMSEELERIVLEVQEKEEVQPLSDEEVINRLFALTKAQGDAIDEKLKDNPTLTNFFQRMSYSSFQILADAYLEEEASPIHNPPTVLPTAPELVKLAFTYDFTAKIARLSKQNLGHITGLGNRYLQDRFEYQQACTDHPLSDSEG